MIKKFRKTSVKMQDRNFMALFDTAWYKKEYSDAIPPEADLISHYSENGFKAGYKPNPLFDPIWYLKENPDVASEGKEPLRHYSEFGYKEGRQPHPLFDPMWYLSEYPDVAEDGAEPLSHYLMHGSKEGRYPNPLFSPRWYLSTNPDVSAANFEPFTHYILHGSREGRRPNPLFNPAWYLEQNRDVAAQHFEALSHYLKFGFREGRKPHPIFDPEWYLLENEDVRTSHLEPLTHFIRHGLPEGRRINHSFAIEGIHNSVFNEEFSRALDLAVIQHVKVLLTDHIFSKNNHIVVFLPQEFTNLDTIEGFGRRVAFVDDILSCMPRLYVTVKYGSGPDIYPKKLDNGSWQIVLLESDLASLNILDYVLAHSSFSYGHSVFSLVTEALRLRLPNRKGQFIFDAHGLVPEEAELSGEVNRVPLLSEVESFCIFEADYLVTVSKKMSRHFATKYSLNATLIELPFLCPAPPFDTAPLLEKESRVVYVGGAQPWQQLPLMLEAIKESRHPYNFIIYTNTVDLIQKMVSNFLPGRQADKIVIRSMPNDALLSDLHKASYGFVLRERNAVNEVACPTKLVEYISCGVVPILNSEAIGDFQDLGLNYIRLVDFLDGVMPSDSERACLAGANSYVLRRFQRVCESGMRDLLKAVFSGEKISAYFVDDVRGFSFQV